MWRILPLLLALEDDVGKSEKEESEEESSPAYDSGPARDYNLPEIKEERELEKEAKEERHLGEPGLERDVTDEGYPEPEFSDGTSLFDYDPEELEGVEESTANDNQFAQELADKSYDDQQEAKAPQAQEIANKNPRGFLERVGDAVRNIPYMAKFAFNTLGAGYVPVKNINQETIEKLREDPSLPVMDIVKGSFNNMASMATVAKQAKENGYLPYVHGGINYGRDEKDNVDQLFENKKNMLKEAGLYQDPEAANDDHEISERAALYTRVPSNRELSRRNDLAVGHSSGSVLLEAAKRDPRAAEYGWGGGTHGLSGTGPFKPSTLAQRGIMTGAKHDDARRPEARRGDVERQAGTPYTHSHSYGFSRDGLVRPENTVNPSAETHHVVDHPNGTHFRQITDPDVIDAWMDLIGRNRQITQYGPEEATGMDYDPSVGHRRVASDRPRPEDYEPKGAKDYKPPYDEERPAA